MTSAALSEDARLAIDIRYKERHDRATRDCRAMLQKLYPSGSLDPDETLRTWCDSDKRARWGGSRPPAPQVCVGRYGGWRRS